MSLHTNILKQLLRSLLFCRYFPTCNDAHHAKIEISVIYSTLYVKKYSKVILEVEGYVTIVNKINLFD